MNLFLALLMLIWSDSVSTEDTGAVGSGDLSHFVHIKSGTVNDLESVMKSHVSLGNCATLCLDDITCASFEHEKEKQICFLSKKSAKDNPIEFHANLDYYQAILPDENLIGMKGISVEDADKLERFTHLSIEDCDFECRGHPECKSYAYKSRSKLCYLTKETYLDQDLGISKYGWDVYFVNQAKKEVNCGSPPRLGFKSVTYTSNVYKSQAVYHCVLGETFISTCRVDGKWSKPNGICKNPTTCKEFKNCGESLGDGEYWINPVGLNGKKMKVYCSEMQTENPKEYISLIGENFSFYPAKKILFFCFTRSTLSWKKPGRTIFNKIRINPENLKVNGSDFKFAELAAKSGDNKWGYGVAADCLFKKDSYCQSRGQMKIDLTDTGLAVDRKVSWTTFGNDSRIDELKRSRNGQVLSATCGGHCGGCKLHFIKLVPAKIGPADETARTCQNV